MGYRSRINNYEFHFYAFAGTFRDAKHLRRNMTETEKILWQAIRNRKISGFKLRRQHPVGQFIVDFHCVKARLVIEVDENIKRVIERLLTTYHTPPLSKLERGLGGEVIT
jgi:hypothetical protein